MTELDNAIIAAAEILVSLPLEQLEQMRERLLDRPEDNAAIDHAIVMVGLEIENAATQK